MTRLVPALALAALLATACAADDQVNTDPLDVATTVPQVTAAPDDPNIVYAGDHYYLTR